MRDDRFAWSEAKARANLEKHGVSFEVARRAFDDPASIVEIDDREDYGEERLLITGMANRGVLTVAYTERNGRNRIVSARKATRREQERYFSQDF